MIFMRSPYRLPGFAHQVNKHFIRALTTGLSKRRCSRAGPDFFLKSIYLENSCR